MLEGSVDLVAVTSRLCRTCQADKPPTEFYIYPGLKKDGTRGYHLDCKPCVRADIFQRRKVKASLSLKTKRCNDCHLGKPIHAFNPRSAAVCHVCGIKTRTLADAALKPARLGRAKVRQDVSSGFRVCRTCGERKPLTEFPKHGFAGKYCRPDCRLCSNARHRFYGRDWTRRNQLRQRLKDRKRRARKRGAEGTHTIEDIARIRKAQKDRCCFPWCRVKLNGGGSIEHRVSLENGGSNWPSNLQISCQPCNSSKGTRHEIDFVQSKNAVIEKGQMRLL